MITSTAPTGAIAEFERLLLRGDGIGAGDVMALYELPETTQEAFAAGFNRRHEIAAVQAAESASAAAAHEITQHPMGRLALALERMMNEVKLILSGNLRFEDLSRRFEDLSNSVVNFESAKTENQPIQPVAQVEMAKVVLTISGGALQGVVSDQPVAVLVLDYDVEDVDDHALTVMAKNAGSRPEKAQALRCISNIDPIECWRIFDLVEQGGIASADDNEDSAQSPFN